MVYVYLPLMVLPLYASMEKLDFRLIEAGYDLYANSWQVLRRIIIPLVKPGIIAGSILVFIPSLGAYVTPRVLGGGKNMMLGNLIELQFGQGRNWPLGSAISITLMVIVMVALLIYVRNATRSGGRGMARRFNVRRQPGFTTIAMICMFFLLYLPIATLVVFCVQRRIVAGGVGGLLLPVVRSRLEQRAGAGGGAALARDRGSAASIATSRATMAALATTRHRELSRPDHQLRHHQPAADGAGDRDGGGAADRVLRAIKVWTGYSGLGYLITAHTAFCIPFAYLPIRARLESMDLTLERAAADLYATPWKAFQRVTLPLLWPGILAGFMLAFVISLDDVVITEFVKSGGQETLPTYMLGQLRRSHRRPRSMRSRRRSSGALDV